ncbi:hypothetical protein BC940DRAFT_304818 [Gongronella butleri]|nr:hypothetical protein BC940DRAFT_304818 [Gongronella butleri]
MHPTLPELSSVPPVRPPAMMDSSDDDEFESGDESYFLSSSSSTTTSSCASTPPTVRKGSIASLLNSIGELEQLDQEEWSTNYQTHFMNDVILTKKTNNGLRYFSQHVCDLLREHGRMSYQELVDQLLDHDHKAKNIRRRVYDALNVLFAVQFIRKENKYIVWQRDVVYAQKDLHHAAQMMPLDAPVDHLRQQVAYEETRYFQLKDIVVRQRQQLGHACKTSSL